MVGFARVTFFDRANPMDDIPDSYDLQTVEQLRAVADELRQRILRILSEQARTVTQVGEELGIAAARIHYHVKELERVRLVRRVSTRENRGILEKYYRAVAINFAVPAELLHNLPPDESVATASGWIREIARNFERALRRAGQSEERAHRTAGLSRIHLWLTDDEFGHVMNAVEEALQPYQQPRGVGAERERTFVQLMYDTRDAEPAAEEEPVPARTPELGYRFKINHAVWVGAMMLGRDELERYDARGETLDVTVLGLLTVKDDVPPELVDRVLSRLRHRGKLAASPEVRAVLEEKAAKRKA